MTASTTRSEAATFWRYISSTLDRLVTLALEIDPEGLHWQPPAPQTNSIATLAFHTLGNAEENILATLCGQKVKREYAREFATENRDAGELRERWESLRPRLEQALSDLPDERLDEFREHPRRGSIAGREVLIVVARHAAEHLGQAELTRDLWVASDSR